MEKLKKLHGEVKYHPFRLKESDDCFGYLHKHFELLNQFSKICIKEYALAEIGFGHSYMEIKNKAAYYYETHQDLRFKLCMAALECYLALIHTYIDTEDIILVDKCINVEKNLWRHYQWNEQENGFILSKQDLEDRIKYLEKRYKNDTATAKSYLEIYYRWKKYYD